MDNNQAVGKALYAEFRNGSQTYQVILMPDGIAKNGRYVPATAYRRQVSAAKPRKAWKTQALPAIELDTFGAFIKLNEQDAISSANTRLAYYYSTFQRLSDYGYKLYQKLIVVEVSVEDITDVYASKTPYKVLGRITRCRRALGFGEELFAK